MAGLVPVIHVFSPTGGRKRPNGAAETSSLGNDFAGLAIEANQANPAILGDAAMATHRL